MTLRCVSLRRHFITLLELLIVIAILALVSGVIGVNIKKALLDQRFRMEVGMILDELRLAQDLMLILSTDVHVKFSQDKEKKGIKYWLELETELPERLKKQILQKKDPVKMTRLRKNPMLGFGPV